MKRSRTIAPTTIFSIPYYILTEILSKLPISTICNCRCVCSYFRNLISDPEFGKLHLSRSQPSLLLYNFYWECVLYSVESIGPCVDNRRRNDDVRIPIDKILKFKPKFDVPTQGLAFLSSCNGLICFCSRRTYNPYVICNPVINEYVIVPQTEKGFFDHLGSGFGFCPETNHYKLLRFLSPSIGFGFNLEAEINTLGTNLWRRVEDAPRYLHWYSSGCFLNGALHWIVHNSKTCFESMCCFDFGKERFQPFPGPSQFRGLPGELMVDRMKMGVLKDGLSVFHHPTNDRLDIWVMKDYAVQESWTKDLVIKVPSAESYYGNFYEPLMVLNNGDILMIYALSALLSWNMTDKSFRNVRVKGIPSIIRAISYIPSFVSIKNAATGR